MGAERAKINAEETENGFKRQEGDVGRGSVPPSRHTRGFPPFGCCSEHPGLRRSPRFGALRRVRRHRVGATNGTTRWQQPRAPLPQPHAAIVAQTDPNRIPHRGHPNPAGFWGSTAHPRRTALTLPRSYRSAAAPLRPLQTQSGGAEEEDGQPAASRPPRRFFLGLWLRRTQLAAHPAAVLTAARRGSAALRERSARVAARLLFTAQLLGSRLGPSTWPGTGPGHGNPTARLWQDSKSPAPSEKHPKGGRWGQGFSPCPRGHHPVVSLWGQPRPERHGDPVHPQSPEAQRKGKLMKPRVMPISTNESLRVP